MPSFLNLAVAALVADVVSSVPLGPGQHKINYNVDVGPRPYYIINNMTNGALRESLTACENSKLEVTQFTIGHRGGGTLQFPEETVESTMAGARMGYVLQNTLSTEQMLMFVPEPVFWNVM